MKVVKYIFLFLPFTFLISCSSKIKTTYVDYVYDGDTFYDKNKRKFRIFGIDTPELKTKNLEFTQGLQYFYSLEAKKKVSELILNKKIKFEKLKIDKYNRIISKVWINKIDVAILLLNFGLAKVAYIDLNKYSPFYTKDFSYYKTLLNAQFYAYKNKVGIWKHKNNIKDIFPN